MTAPEIDLSGENITTVPEIDLSGEELSDRGNPRDTLKPISKFQLLLAKSALPIRAIETGAGLFPTSPLTTGLGEGLIRYGESGDLKTAIKTGLTAGGADAALMAATAGMSKIPGIKNLAKNALSSSGEFLAGIPKEAYRRILDNPNLLKGKFNPNEKFAELGKYFSKSLDELDRRLGSDVGGARDAALYNTTETASKLPEFSKTIESRYYPERGESALRKEQENLISKFGESMEPKIEVESSKILGQNGLPLQTTSIRTPTIGDKQRTIIALDGQINWHGTDNTTKLLLKQQRHLLNEELRKEAPDVAKANDAFSEMTTLKEKIGKTPLAEQNIEVLMHNLKHKTADKQDVIKELGRLTGTDVSEKAEDIWARDFFESVSPPKTTVTDGQKGMGNSLRTAIMTAAGTATAMGHLNPLSLMLAGSFSPLVHRTAIRHAGKLPAIGKLLRPTAGMAAGSFVGNE